MATPRKYGKGPYGVGNFGTGPYVYVSLSPVAAELALVGQNVRVMAVEGSSTPGFVTSAHQTRVRATFGQVAALFEFGAHFNRLRGFHASVSAQFTISGQYKRVREAQLTATLAIQPEFPEARSNIIAAMRVSTAATLSLRGPIYGGKFYVPNVPGSPGWASGAGTDPGWSDQNTAAGPWESSGAGSGLWSPVDTVDGGWH